MKVRVMKVTPQIAAKWLESNTINRPLRPGVVEGYRAAFQRGEYILTHQGIAFSDTGDLLDGQHRLCAIAEMPDSFAVEMSVATDVDPRAFLAMDQGLKRGSGDILGVPTGHAAVARYLAVIVNTTKAGVTTQMLIPYVKGIAKPYDELLKFCQLCSKTWSSSAVRSAAILHMLNGSDSDYVKLVYHSLNHAEFDTMPPVAQTIFRQHLRGTASNQSYDMFCRAFKMFDRRNQAATKIQINDNGTILARAREIISQRVLGQVVLQKSPPTAPKKAPARREHAMAR
jgi:hypothetical protein